MSHDSGVTIANHATTYFGRDGVELFRVKTLKSSISLWLKCGLIPTRGVTITKMLKLATHYTGQKYTTKKAQQAVEDLQAWIDTMSSALPIDDQREGAA